MQFHVALLNSKEFYPSIAAMTSAKGQNYFGARRNLRSGVSAERRNLKKKMKNLRRSADAPPRSRKLFRPKGATRQ